MRMIEPSSDLFDTQATAGPLYLCPNPKPSARDKAAFGRLASLYTAFSTEFASFAVKYCLAHGHRRIGDPFAGMGTLGEAARDNAVTLSLTGAGKSEFCYQFARAAQEDRGTDPLRIEAGLAQTEELLIANLCAQLKDAMQVAEQGFAENAERFLGRLLPNLQKIGGAMIKDAATVLGQGEKTVEALSDFLSGIDSDPDLYDQ